MGWACFWARFLSTHLGGSCVPSSLSLFLVKGRGVKKTPNILACMYGIEKTESMGLPV